MVIYFSWGGNTKMFAEVLGAKKGLPVFQLREKVERKRKMSFVIGCFQGMTKTQTEVVEMPKYFKL